MRPLPVAALILLLAAPAARAAILDEATMPDGAFGGGWAAPAEVGPGVETVFGTGGANAYDTLVFTGLPAGAQTITLAFRAPEARDAAYSAGGSVLFDDEPFDYAWDGTTVGPVQVDDRNPEVRLSLTLDDDFGGTLYLALNFTHGADLAWTISAPSNLVLPAVVPVPAGILLIGGAIASLAALRLRRRG